MTLSLSGWAHIFCVDEHIFLNKFHSSEYLKVGYIVDITLHVTKDSFRHLNRKLNVDKP